MPYEIHSIGTRTELRQTFDNVAHLYDEMRPSYPDQVFADVVQISGAGPTSPVLEIGCGTGHATQVLAAKGLAIHCIELGENMAAVARQRLARYPQVSIEVADFDVWSTAHRYDMVYSATAYHWLNPATREQRIAAVLDPMGWLAIWRNRHIRNGSCDDFLDEAHVIYAEEAPELVKKRALLPNPEQVAETERDELTRQYFGDPELRVYLWSRPYTAAQYVQMLNTHSDHQLLAADRRARLFDRLAALIDNKYGGSVTKDYATLLQMAQRSN